MSTILRPALARGHANHGGLDSYHSFSFAGYYDAAHMGFGPLRVINEDRVAPGMGFDTHGHRDMEIISYVVEGALAHQDSLGSGGVIRPGDVQVMSAGRGIRHSEFNGSKTAPVHFLQIWIQPDTAGIPPAYAQKSFEPAHKHNQLCLLASPNGREGSLAIHQAADVYAALLEPGKSLHLDLRPGRGAWVQVIKGALEVNGLVAATGDGVVLRDETRLALVAKAASECLVFDLPILAPSLAA